MNHKFYLTYILRLEFSLLNLNKLFEYWAREFNTWNAEYFLFHYVFNSFINLLLML